MMPHRITAARALLPRLALSAAALWASPAALAQPAANAVRPLTVYDALTLRRPFPVGAPSVSPDEALVAVEVEERARARDRRTGDGIRTAWHPATELLVVERATGAQRRVVSDSAAHWGPSWSPDGRALAFLSDAGGLASVWVWDRATARARRVTTRPLARGTGEVGPLEWTPDGRGIVLRLVPQDMALVGPRALLRERGADTASGLTLERFAGGGAPGLGSTERPARRHFRDDAPLDLGIVDVATGAIRTLLRRTTIHGPTWLSPSGRAIAFVSLDTGARGAYELRELSVYDLGTGEVRRIARPRNATAAVTGSVGNLGYVGVSWSPDGRRLAYRDDSARVGDQYVVDVAGAGAPRLATPGPHPRFRTPYLLGAQWSPGGDALYLLGADTVWRADAAGGALRPIGAHAGWELRRIVGPGRTATVWSPDGRSLLVVARQRATQRMGVLRLDLSSGEMRPAFEGDVLLDHGSAFGVGATSVVYVEQSAARPPAYWTADAGFARRRPLTTLDRRHTRYALGRHALVRWRSLHGEELDGVLVYPAGYVAGRRYPLVVSAYPGAWQGPHVNVFGPTTIAGIGTLSAQLLATRGYAVLLASAPVRPGHRRFDLAATVLPGVNRVVELGVADPERLGVIGHSDGGNAVLALLTQTPRFKAGVVMAGYADDVTLATAASLGDVEYFAGRWALWERNYGYGGSPWERPTVWWENSPLHYFDRITAPVLITHGTRDGSAPVHAADQVYAALRRLGKSVAYAKYDDQAHDLSTWTLSTALDATARVIDWLDLHVKGATTRSDAPRRTSVDEGTASGRTR